MCAAESVVGARWVTCGGALRPVGEQSTGRGNLGGVLGEWCGGDSPGRDVKRASRAVRLRSRGSLTWGAVTKSAKPSPSSASS